MGIFGRSPSVAWDLENIPRPWGTRASIYAHILANRSEDGSLEANADTLPDEAPGDERTHFAPGVVDSAFGSADSPGRLKWRAARLVAVLRALLERATERSLRQVYKLSSRGPVVAAVDYLPELLSELQRDFGSRRMLTVARCFAREAPDRETVKLGIVMLGVVSEKEVVDEELLTTLGLHEEFTLYVADALRARGVPDRLLFELAKKVHGWGRIELIERLAETQDPGIRRWMLREGYQNSIMLEYTAFTCATTGGLLAALKAVDVDTPLLRGAGAIIDAILAGDPGPGIEEYEEGFEAMVHYVAHVMRVGEDLTHHAPVAAIRWQLRALDDPPAEAASLLAKCEAYLALPGWNGRIREGLASDDERTFFLADRAAADVGIDTWEFYLTRVRADSTAWFRLMQQTTADRIDAVVSLAESLLPVGEIASGPSDALGLGSEFRPHSALSFILQDLGRFPGHGTPLILVGLRSPVVNNRNMALRAAAEWTTDRWPPQLREALAVAAKIEPCRDVRKLMRRVLRGDSIDT